MANKPLYFHYIPTPPPLTTAALLSYIIYMAIIGLFSSGKTEGKKKAAKKLAAGIAKAKKATKKKSKTCEFC